MKVQDKIRTLRTSKGWTQEKMAELLNLSPNGYANIERGETDLTLSRLEQIAKLFETNYLDLLNMGEKTIGFYLNGNNNNYCQIQSDEQTVNELDKLKIKNEHLNEKNVLLEKRLADLEKIIAHYETR